jgi:hypothetical protein
MGKGEEFCMKTSLMLTVVALCAAGCASNYTHEADRGLEGTLRAEVNEKHVHVDVDHGVVKLEGNVPTEADRERLDALVQNTPGVVAVKDRLHVEFPTPGTYGANQAAVPVPSSVPVFTTPLPAVGPPAVVTTPPPPVVVPDVPRVKVQAATPHDQEEAARIVSHLHPGQLPMQGIEDVTITVQNGNVALNGTVNSHEDRSALIAAVENAGGVTAIYDQLQVR